MEQKEKYKELYEQYKKSRDAELDKFWKNSTYVWTFLGLCFTAYSALIIKFIDADSSNFKLQLSISAVCTFGFLLSCIWRWMAQGLKAWYEVFEYAVWDMESYHNVFDYPSNFTIGNYWVVDEKKSSRPFSPSALVVAIGCCMIVFWIVAFLFNCLPYFFDCFNEVAKSSTDNVNKLCCGFIQTQHPVDNPEKGNSQKTFFLIMNGVLVVLNIIVLCVLYYKKINSSSLRTGKYEQKFTDIKKRLLDKKIPYKYLEVKQKNNKDTILLLFDKKYENQEDEISKKISKFKEELEKENKSLYDIKFEYNDIEN